MSKTYRGNPPDLTDGWAHVATIENDESNWLVFERDQEKGNNWVTYKVCVDNRAANKANYWFTWRVTTGERGFDRDFRLLEQQRPELYRSVVEFLGERHKTATQSS